MPERAARGLVDLGAESGLAIEQGAGLRDAYGLVEERCVLDAGPLADRAGPPPGTRDASTGLVQRRQKGGRPWDALWHSHETTIPMGAKVSQGAASLLTAHTVEHEH